MSESNPTILLVDDDETFRKRLARALTERGYVVREAPDGEAAIASAREESPELALVDLRMPGPSGLEVVKALHALDPSTKIVVLTGYGSIATALDAVRLGATHYLTKPADVNEILAAFSRGEEQASTASAEHLEAPTLARVEWEHIQRVLQDCDGNISEAARRLGIHRRSLQRKLAKYPSPH
ncbi:MAG: response regulator transcription factor [Myxococcales bacterium]|jgi:two-component system response regulator RegA|nr:response regulator transcription factor [Myxococcales bacterium]